MTFRFLIIVFISVLATNAVAQEIKISGNSTEIVDGDAFPGFSDDTYFAGAGVSSGTVSKTFTIENTGSSTLTLSGSSPYISISGTNSADFSVTSAPSNSISGSSSTTFTVEFDPSAAGVREAELTITSNDADEGTYNFIISGIGIGVITAASPLGSTGAQIGLDIDGEASYDYSGRSVSLSSDGTVLAIGAYGNDGNGSSSGHVRVYEYSGSSWSQLGSDIDGEASVDYSGSSVSLSSDGTVLAIGAYGNDGNGSKSGHVRVYEYNGSTWTQLGSDIDGEASGDESGGTVSISGDGTVLAIGARYNDGGGSNSGHVRIYEYNGSTWTQLGSDIDGEASGDQSGGIDVSGLNGSSLNLSTDGTVLAIGATLNDGNGSSSGHVRVYKYSGSSWSQLGSDIDGEANFDNSGGAVSLSSDGTILAVGAGNNDGNGSSSGHVRVYQYSSSSWIQLGSDIDGEANFDQSGRSVNLSSDGTVLAVGAVYNDANGSNSGQVRVYKYSGSSWSQLGSDIDGEASSDNSGFSVSLSSDGTVLAIGAPYNDGTGSDAGHVRIYKLNEAEILITGNSVEIKDGDTSPRTADDTDFGQVNPSSGTVSKTFTIKNEGVVDLTLSGSPLVSLSGTNASDFSVTTQPSSSTITAGNSTTFTIEFDPSTTGTKTATVTLTSNDANEATYTFDIKGLGIYEEIKVTGNGREIIDGDSSPRTADDTDFGDVALSKTISYTIENIGGATLTLTGSSPVSLTGSSNFSITSQPGSTSISAGSSTTFSITYTPTVLFAIDEAEISIASDDDDEATYNFSIQAIGVAVSATSPLGSTGAQIGLDIDGEASYDYSGRSVSLSSDGTVLAIGAYGNDGNGSSSGHVRVYEYSGSSWSQLGSDIDGEASVDYSGSSVSLSSDGTVLAIGAYGNDGNGSKSGHVRVYEYNGSTWTQLGSDIDGEASGDESGGTVSISGDGTVLAIGARYNDGGGSNSGHVRIYEYNGSTWTQLGSDIDGEASGDQSGGIDVSGLNGSSLNLSTDGTVLAIGATLNDGNGSSSGHVRVYKYSGSSWSQLGSDIDGEANFDNSGGAVSLSSDGTILAVGAGNNDGNGSSSGHVRVYQYSSSSWIQLGSDIDGEANFDQSGRSVNLSSDGTVLAVGAVYNDANGSNSGQVRVYKYSGSSWSQLGSDIDGEASSDNSGFSVSLSSDGTVLAIGAPYNDGTGSDAGHVRIYKLNEAEIKITGNSVEIKDGDSSPRTADDTDFGQTNPSSGTVSKTFTIKNEGVVDLTLSGSPLVALSGTNASDFSITTQPSSSTITAGNSTTFTIEFDPSTTGTKTATVTITSNDANEATYTFDIEGEGAEPEIKISGNSTEIADGDDTPSSTDHTDFGSISASSGTISKTYTIENTGSSTLTLSGSSPYVSISGTNSGDFSVTSTPSNSISASSSTSFTIEFDPSATGTRTATISISSDDADESPYTFDIEGEGVEPEIKISGNSTEIVDGDDTPSSTDHTDFGSVLASSGTVSRTFTIDNTGSGTLTLSGSSPYVSISGTNSADFSVTSTPSNSISASSSTSFTIEFDPSATGTRTATISISSDDADEGTYNFDIEGEGTAPEIKISGNSTEIVDGDNTPSTADHTDFGSATASSGTVSRTFTIENTGTGTLSISGSSPYVVISGTNSADFSVTTAPSNSISASSSTTFTVEFDPSATGTRTATLTISSDDADEGTYNFDIEGEGTVPEIKISANNKEIADDDTSPSITDYTYFGGVPTASGTISRTFTIDNTGTGALTLSGSPYVSISGTNSGDFSVTTQPSSASIAASNSLTFVVEFDPSASGERTAELSISNDDADESTYNFDISGVGISAVSDIADNTESRLGSDLDGEAAGDQFGFSVDFSEDGTIMAIGGINNAGGGTAGGHVRVFHYTSGSWTQLGSDIDGEATNDQSGYSVALSGDGTKVAIGAVNNDGTGTNAGHVRVYSYSSSAWSQLGGDIDGEAASDKSGISVGMSYDGTIVAIGADYNDGTGTDAGHVRVYQYGGSSWSQLGGDIDAEAAGDGFGRALALAGHGKILAIAARLNDGSYSNAGHVRVMEYNNGSWSQLGSDIDGEASTDLSGRSVAISADGTIVAIGSSNNDGNGGSSGHVRVYQYASGSWSQLGSDIDGESSGDESGYSVALSDDGTILAIGAIKNDGSATDAGHVRMYKYSSSTWTQLGADIDGEAGGDQFGWAVALSGDGSHLAIGARYNDGTGTNAGHVQVYGLHYAEVSISGNNVLIVDGDATASIKDHTYFGSVDATSATKKRIFTINNEGAAGTLELSGSPIVSVSGTNSSDFSVSSQPSASTIAATNSLTFTVEFNPSAEGVREAEISITCNDEDESTYNFGISGLGSSIADYPFDWTWYGGSSSKDPSGVYGTKGTGASANVPGGRKNAMNWKDANGNIYLFGGYGLDVNGDEGHLNDLWKYDGSNWIWLSGSDEIDANGVYGTMGTASSLNVPGARWGAVGYIDGSDNLWLFGGNGFPSSGTTNGNMNDLWKWDGTNWTWIGGDDNINQKSNYGTTGQYSSSTWPRGTHESTSWLDGNGVFWIFGGYGRDNNNQGGQLNDLWKWNGSQWAFVGGSKTRKPAGKYTTGTLWPGGRRYGAAWVDAGNNLWLFGGHGADKTTTNGYLNDLWKYNGSQWTWVAGDDDRNQSGAYGTQGKAASSNVPGGRRWCSFWMDGSGNMTIYGGYGYDANGVLGALNDMWIFDGSNWAWVSGEKTYNESGNFGTLGTTNSDDYPGAKYGGVQWIDDSGNLWVMGGEGKDGSGNDGYTNDLWQMELAFIWDGSSTTWGTTGNWKHGGVPGTSYSVKIPSGLSSYPALSSNISVKTLEIESGGALSISSGNTLTITDNFSYAGTSALALGSGTLKFNGSSAQTIDGKIDGNVEIDNSNDVTLGADATISTLTLTSGDLDIANNDLTLGTASGGSSTSYIKVSGTGRVTAEVGSSPITLPIGRNPYLPIIIDDGGGNNYTVGVSNGVFDNPVTQANEETDNVVSETWTIQSDASQTGVSVTLQWELDEEEGTFTRSTSNLAYWENGVSSTWNTGSSMSASGSGPYSLTRSVNFSTNLFYFGVGSANSALPVDLTYFNAQWMEEGKEAMLGWQTAMEENNSHFEIERSFNGLDFEVVGSVEGHGSTFKTNNYQFADELLVNNFQQVETVYYSLKQVDYDGQFDYSQTKTLNMHNTLIEFGVYPNPVNGGVINTTEFGNYQVYTTSGKLLLRRENTLVIDIGELQKGSYLIKNDKGNTAMFVKH